MSTFVFVTFAILAIGPSFGLEGEIQLTKEQILCPDLVTKIIILEKEGLDWYNIRLILSKYLLSNKEFSENAERDLAHTNCTRHLGLYSGSGYLGFKLYQTDAKTREFLSKALDNVCGKQTSYRCLPTSLVDLDNLNFTRICLQLYCMSFIVENVGDPLDQPRFKADQDYQRYLSTRQHLAYLEQVKDSRESMAAIGICMPELALRETPLLCEELAKKVINDYQRGKSAEDIRQEAQAIVILLIDKAKQGKTVEEMCAAANHLVPAGARRLYKKLATNIKNDYQIGKSDLYILQAAEASVRRFIHGAKHDETVKQMCAAAKYLPNDNQLCTEIVTGTKRHIDANTKIFIYAQNIVDCVEKHGFVLRFAYCKEFVDKNTDTIVQELKRGKTTEQICGQISLSKAAANPLPNYKEICMEVATETKRYTDRYSLLIADVSDAKEKNERYCREKYRSALTSGDHCLNFAKKNTKAIVWRLYEGQTTEQICGQISLSKNDVKHLPINEQLCIQLAAVTKRFTDRKNLQTYFANVNEPKEKNEQYCREKYRSTPTYDYCVDFAEKNTHAMVCRFYGGQTTGQICATTYPFHERICMAVATEAMRLYEEKKRKRGRIPVSYDVYYGAYPQGKYEQVCRQFYGSFYDYCKSFVGHAVFILNVLPYGPKKMCENAFKGKFNG